MKKGGGGIFKLSHRSHHFSLLASQFDEWLAAINFSPKTRATYGHDVRYFLKWLEENVPITSIAEVTPKHVQQYQMSVYNYQRPPQKNGKQKGGLSASTQMGRLVAIHKFFEWLLRQQQIAYSPAASLQMPRYARPLPRNILSVAEARKLIEATPTDAPKGMRDQAMVELLYATGMRVGELIALQLYDVDFSSGTIHIRQGKGKKDRVIPITERTAGILKAYVTEAREAFAKGDDNARLFVSVHTGRPLARNDVAQTVRDAALRAGITKVVTPHTLRHTCATHLLKGQVDIRHIQKLLGHSQLSSTEIYTHVETSDLREMLRRFHPRETEDGISGQ